ncbi:hypothetical protein GCM10017044_27780 [Kordiimonas sediminis]|uniref:Uncharacterized protein n=1 Tax=Kordiimonas sediminis TaxID=1735581 RepID=A0A919AXU5_9PROT|nr:hypothetical protein [Kordiimonas sediminis]GHF30831.1 hypothetical protein GCM10017044_27780 [Kordiimonas sediminis]
MTFSKREKSIYIELIVDIIAAGFYFSFLFSLSTPIDNPLEALGGTLLKITVASIIATIILHTFIIGADPVEAEDERDKAIKHRSTQLGYYALFTLNVIIIGSIFIDTFLEIPGSQPRFVALDTPFMIANAIVFALIAAGLVKGVSQLVLYRRGF